MLHGTKWRQKHLGQGLLWLSGFISNLVKSFPVACHSTSGILVNLMIVFGNLWKQETFLNTCEEQNTHGLCWFYSMLVKVSFAVMKQRSCCQICCQCIFSFNSSSFTLSSWRWNGRPWNHVCHCSLFLRLLLQLTFDHNTEEGKHPLHCFVSMTCSRKKKAFT